MNLPSFASYLEVANFVLTNESTETILSAIDVLEPLKSPVQAFINFPGDLRNSKILYISRTKL